jgi:phosphoribosylanthranilate isomerase
MSRSGRTRVCVYGVRGEEEALAAAEAGADAVGMIFNPRSGRFVEPEEAWEIAAILPPLVATIGIFENAPVDKFVEIEERCPTDYSHLHGDEPEDVARQCGTRAIKTVRGDAAALEREAARWAKVDEIDALMIALDAATITDPGVLAAVGRIVASRVRPVLIGGGLAPENVAGVIAAARPWAVVVSGGVEEGGRKSPERMAAFCRAAAAADSAR